MVSKMPVPNSTSPWQTLQNLWYAIWYCRFTAAFLKSPGLTNGSNAGKSIQFCRYNFLLVKGGSCHCLSLPERFFDKSRNTGEEEIAREESAGGSIEVGNCVSFLLLVMLAVGKEIESCFYRFFMPVSS